MEASPKSGLFGPHGAAVGSRMLLIQPDAVLCKLCARGSDDAFEVLHGRYRQQVFAFVYHLLNRRDAVDDAEDITQDVFSKVFSSIRSKDGEGSFKHWLFAIARNRTFDHIRARKPQGLPLDEVGEAPHEASNVVSIAAQVERRAELAWLVTAVGELPERQREALVMKELGGMSHNEIADALDTSVDATKQLIKRGRASIGESAERSGYRSRNLGKELAMAAPIVPLAAAGLGFTASSASAAAAVGGLTIGSKVAATALVVAAIGGGAVAVEKVDSAGSKSAEHASPQAASKAAAGSAVVAGGSLVGDDADAGAAAGGDDSAAAKRKKNSHRHHGRSHRSGAGSKGHGGGKGTGRGAQRSGSTKSQGSSSSHAGSESGQSSGSGSSGARHPSGGGSQGSNGSSGGSSGGEAVESGGGSNSDGQGGGNSGNGGGKK